MYETHLTVSGNVATPVVRRCLPDGTTLVNFRVASNERRFNRDTGVWSNGDSLYLPVTCWRQLAENVLRTFSVGDPIIIRGRLFTRSFEDKEGQQRSVTEFEGLAVGPDLSRAIAKITRLNRDGTPIGLVPVDADEERDRETAADGGATPVLATESDDPWRSTDRAADDPFGERVDEVEPDGSPAEAAVGA